VKQSRAFLHGFQPSVSSLLIRYLSGFESKGMILKGIESKGMILMAENHEGKLCFVSPTEAFGNGNEVR
jgi:hypothetical protein